MKVISDDCQKALLNMMVLFIQYVKDDPNADEELTHRVIKSTLLLADEVKKNGAIIVTTLYIKGGNKNE